MLSIKKQKLLILMCFLLYVFSYIGRYSYNSNIVSICSDYNISKSEAGLVATFFFISYGTGQFINGMLCKKYNKKIILTLALVISGLLNLIVFFKPPFAIIKYLWLINGFLLATLWPSIIGILGENLDEKLLNKAIIIMNTTTACGTVIIYSISSICTTFDFYRLTFLLAFIICISTGIVWFIFCGKDIGKPIKENIVINKANEKITKKATFYVLYLLIILGVLAIVVNLFKDGLNTWVPNILKETFGYPDNLSIILTIALPILGIFGSPLAILVNKKTKSYLLSLSILFFSSLLCIIAIIFAINNKIPVMIVIAFAIVSLLSHSMNGLITGIVPLAERERYSSGKMAGILNAFSYVGSAISSFGLGLLADNFNWLFIFNLFLVLVIVSTAISLISGLALIKKQKEVN